jgi:hypothetical protein
MRNVDVVFCFVCFPHFAELFEEGFDFGVDFTVLFRFGVDFSSSQEIFQCATDTTFVAQKRQVN